MISRIKWIRTSRLLIKNSLFSSLGRSMQMQLVQGKMKNDVARLMEITEHIAKKVRTSERERESARKGERESEREREREKLSVSAVQPCLLGFTITTFVFLNHQPNALNTQLQTTDPSTETGSYFRLIDSCITQFKA